MLFGSSAIVDDEIARLLACATKKKLTAEDPAGISGTSGLLVGLDSFWFVFEKIKSSPGATRQMEDADVPDDAPPQTPYCNDHSHHFTRPQIHASNKKRRSERIFRGEKPPTGVVVALISSFTRRARREAKSGRQGCTILCQ